MSLFKRRDILARQELYSSVGNVICLRCKRDMLPEATWRSSMENIKDYSCPPDCPRRSKTCHSECERHQKYREIAEKIRNERYQASEKEHIVHEKAYLKKH